MDRPAVITYVYEYADVPGAVVLRELAASVEAILGFTTEEWFADPQLWQRLLHPDHAQVERLPDGSEVWRGSWTVVPEPSAAEASGAI